ncbi:MAG TPA: hypothetical protein VEB68_14190 [Croceibacterium sp.]|nr:hypothetical protein [Croceibacterium sp.]
MVRKLVAATVSAALCLAPVAPAFAQTYSAADAVQAPLGATATLNLRVPLGGGPNLKEPTYGLTLGYGQEVGTGDSGQLLTRQVNVADIRFSSDGFLRQANVASFDLANLDKDRRFSNDLTGEGNTLWIVVGLVAAGVAICLLADCFEGDDDEDSSSSSN